jgi:glutathione S-transferase
MITLYGFRRVAEPIAGRTRDLPVQWALEETGLPYQVHGLDFVAGDLKTDEYHRLSPFGQVPVIVDDGFILVETGAVLLYLAEKTGKLIPSDLKGRAQVTRWCFAALDTFEPTLVAISTIDIQGKDDPTGPKRRPRLVERSHRRLSGLESWLSGSTYLTGEEFTVADILMATVLREVHTSGLFDDFPRVNSYRKRCEARPAWQRTLSLYESRLGAPPGSTR